MDAAALAASLQRRCAGASSASLGVQYFVPGIPEQRLLQALLVQGVACVRAGRRGEEQGRKRAASWAGTELQARQVFSRFAVAKTDVSTQQEGKRQRKHSSTAMESGGSSSSSSQQGVMEAAAAAAALELAAAASKGHPPTHQSGRWSAPAQRGRSGTQCPQPPAPLPG